MRTLTPYLFALFLLPACKRQESALCEAYFNCVWATPLTGGVPDYCADYENWVKFQGACGSCVASSQCENYQCSDAGQGQPMRCEGQWPACPQCP